jgi:hypothetical protein
MTCPCGRPATTLEAFLDDAALPVLRVTLDGKVVGNDKTYFAECDGYLSRWRPSYCIEVGCRPPLLEEYGGVCGQNALKLAGNAIAPWMTEVPIPEPVTLPAKVLVGIPLCTIRVMHANGQLPGWLVPRLGAIVDSTNFAVRAAGRPEILDGPQPCAVPHTIEWYMTNDPLECMLLPRATVYVRKEDVLPPLGVTFPGAVEPMEVNPLHALVGTPGKKCTMRKPGFLPPVRPGDSCPRIYEV